MIADGPLAQVGMDEPEQVAEVKGEVITRTRRCPVCRGRGARLCYACGGTGRETVPLWLVIRPKEKV